MRVLVGGSLQAVSLSSRRAWIEIINARFGYAAIAVALLTESVDRNDQSTDWNTDIAPSLSSRRAWIEIKVSGPRYRGLQGRSPHGERG